MENPESKIGEYAGVIWKYLEKNIGRSISVSELKLNLILSNNVLYLALGWLLRENKVEVIFSERTTFIKPKE